MSDEKDKLTSALSDPLFLQLGEANPDREAALAAYRKRDKDWDQLIEPVEFLRHHPLVDDDGKPGPNLLQTWPGLGLVLILLGGFVFSLFAFDLKFSEYFPQPGDGTKTPGPERPEPISTRDFPKDYREKIDQLNDSISTEQWKTVVEIAMGLKNDPVAYAAIKGNREAFAQLYEALAAAKMALRGNDLENANEVITLVDEYKTETVGNSTLKLDYQALEARFQLAGDARVELDWEKETENKVVISDSDNLANMYGKQLSETQKKRLRTMRVYCLIRLLHRKTDLEEINNNKQSIEWWRRLTEDLTVWRGKFPEIVKVENRYLPDTYDGKATWKDYHNDHDDHFLKCYEWYWKRLAKLEPTWATNSTFKIGDMQFDGDDAEFNAKMIGEALK